jgi:uncharacterized protein (DUF1800 family)
MQQHGSVTALRRFGLGPKPGDISKVSGDPRGFLLASLKDKNAGRLDDSKLEPSHIVYAAAQEAQMAQRLGQLLLKDAIKVDAGRGASGGPDMSPAGAAGPAMSDGKPATAAAPVAPAGQIRRDALNEELAARIERGISTDNAFVERLVLFWSNHFCVSIAKGQVRGMAGAYEREAIRPHVLGRFSDMLRAVEQHPAMLIYLDNVQSTGPASRVGRNSSRGLNENLARETLELHTLGVDGGYTQTDVTNLARLYTGWTVGQTNVLQSEPGKFFFAINRHDPGEVLLLGKRYADDGQRSAEKALDDLSRHPATARNIATRLARHFVAETPPPALVAALEKAFRDSDGDLAEVSRTLVTANEAWETPAVKIVPPFDFTIALARGLAMPRKPAEWARLAGVLGQSIWQPPSPKGWPDSDDAWMGPSAIRERLRIAERLARDVDRATDPRVLSADLLGPSISDQTRQAIARAETREQGLELLIMSPEFLRR